MVGFVGVWELRLRLCDSVSLLFFRSAAGEAELRDAASPQESLHPTETSGGPAAGRGGLPLQDHPRDLQNLRVSMWELTWLTCEPPQSP